MNDENINEPERSIDSFADMIRARWPLLLGLSFALGVLAYLISTLANSSLWLDELMSLYYTDPVHAENRELWARMSSDLHPPGYYVVLYAWREIWGDSITAVRMLSIVTMMSVLALYVAHVTRRYGSRIAALCIPVVVMSQIFLVYSQEVRGYALLILCSLVCTILYERTCNTEISLWRTLPFITALCFFTETIHPYGVLWSGAICFGLLVYREELTERLAVVAAGLLLLVYPLLRFAWMSELASGNYNWFAFLNPVVELLFGLSRPLIIRQDLPLIAALSVPLIWWVYSRQIAWTRLRRGLPQLLLLPALVIPALGVHFLIEPSFNDRNLAILAPVIWLLLPAAMNAVERSRLNDAIVLGAVVLVCANHVVRSQWLSLGFKSEWRASAAFVDQYAEACRGYEIPVLRFIDMDRDGYFYRYYLRNDVELRLVDRTELDELLRTDSNSGCPIKFWSPHGLSPNAVGSAADLESIRYTTVTFDHTAQWLNTPLEGAFVIVSETG